MTEYHVHLGESGYGYIQFYKWALSLHQVNVRRVKCKDCGQMFEPGQCVYHRQYQGNGYVCIPCAKKLIRKYGDMGFSENVLFNLQSNFTMTGKWTAQEVADALKLRDIDLNMKVEH